MLEHEPKFGIWVNIWRVQSSLSENDQLSCYGTWIWISLNWNSYSICINIMPCLDMYISPQKIYLDDKEISMEVACQCHSLIILCFINLSCRTENMSRKAAGEEPLPEEDPSNPVFKPIPEPARLDSFLITNQISNYCNQINGYILSSSFCAWN